MSQCKQLLNVLVRYDIPAISLVALVLLWVTAVIVTMILTQHILNIL